MKKAAFTLLEILIVVILLGLIAALVIPQMRDQQKEINRLKAQTRPAATQPATTKPH